MIQTQCVVIVEDTDNNYMLFLENIIAHPEECCVWKDYNQGDPVYSRNIIMGFDGDRVAARGWVNGNDHIEYIWRSKDYYVSDGTEEYKASQCQVLRIREGCTAFLQLYNVGDPWLSGTVVAGRKDNGFPIYVVAIEFNGEARIPGQYSPGDTWAFSTIGGPLISTAMEVLVMLWI